MATNIGEIIALMAMALVKMCSIFILLLPPMESIAQEHEEVQESEQDINKKGDTMKVKELKELIEGFPDDATVCVSTDGRFYVPIGGIDYDDSNFILELSSLENACHLVVRSKETLDEGYCRDDSGINSDTCSCPPAEPIISMFGQLLRYLRVKGS